MAGCSFSSSQLCEICCNCSAQRLCSWAKTSPRTVQSGRKTRGAPTGKGDRYLRAALGQMATGAAKTDTFLGKRYRRLIKRMPKAKALAALERSILVIIFHQLSDPGATGAGVRGGECRSGRSPEWLASKDLPPGTL